MAGDRSTQTITTVREYCAAAPDAGRPTRRGISTATAPAQQATTGEPMPVRPRVNLRKPAEYRKALVSGVGAITVVLVALTEPLGGLLGAAATHWMTAGVAATTALATYFTKNAAPADAPGPPAELVQEPSTPSAAAPSPASPPTRSSGAAIAGLALIVGGAVLAGRHTERHRRCVTPFAYVPPGGFSVSNSR
jgi:hypothetical protein